MKNVNNFKDKELGKVNPYGVYDITNNVGWVNVGIDHDTASFAVESIRRWWNLMGSKSYPDAQKLLITADCGGSNGSRVRLWKTELQKLTDEIGLEISVCHFPPGTSKWNKIEHSRLSQNSSGLYIWVINIGIFSFFKDIYYIKSILLKKINSSVSHVQKVRSKAAIFTSIESGRVCF